MDTVKQQHPCRLTRHRFTRLPSLRLWRNKGWERKNLKPSLPPAVNVIKLRDFYLFCPLYRVAKERVVERLSYDRVS
jgi:hypothetical protein